MAISSRCLKRLRLATGGVTSAAVCAVRASMVATNSIHCSDASGIVLSLSEMCDFSILVISPVVISRLTK